MSFFKSFVFLAILGLLAGCSSIAVNQVAEDEFKLEQLRSDAISSFSSSAMTSQAKKLCPTGYSYVLRHAEAKSVLGKHQAECMTGNCDYTLHWHIKCGDIPREKRSIFGKT